MIAARRIIILNFRISFESRQNSGMTIVLRPQEADNLKGFRVKVTLLRSNDVVVNELQNESEKDK